MNRLDALESTAVDFVAKIAPWCAPLPTAFLVGKATIKHLAWPVPVGIVAAVIIESLGLATTTTALLLYQYNQSRRKSDAVAPFWLAALLVAVYFLTSTGLTVALEIFRPLEVYAPAIFPALSLVGVTVLAMRYDHKRRLQIITTERAERKAERQSGHQESRQQQACGRLVNVPIYGGFDANPNHLRAVRREKIDTRIDSLLNTLADNPNITISEAARLIGTSRQTASGYIHNLQAEGRLSKNGHGWEVSR